MSDLASHTCQWLHRVNRGQFLSGSEERQEVMHLIWLSRQPLPITTKTNSYRWSKSQKLQNHTKK